MSEGPIAQWWKAHEPARVSTPNARRTCYQAPGATAAYCGRRLYASTTHAPGVKCADCLAAMRADGVPVSADSGTVVE